MHRPRLSAAVLIGLLVVTTATATADAATGGTFVLGSSNKATSTTRLTNSKGTALALSAPRGHAPLSVGTNHTKVAHLNADLLDGRDSTNFQRRVTGTCKVGSSVVAVAATGKVNCRATSAKSMVVTGTVSNVGGTATCPSRWVLGGGGYKQPFVADETKRDIVRESAPSQALIGFDGWTVVVDPRAVNNFQVNQPTTVYAVCLKVG